MDNDDNKYSGFKLTTAAAAAFAGTALSFKAMLLTQDVSEKAAKFAFDAYTNGSMEPITNNLPTLVSNFGIAAGLFTVGGVMAYKGAQYCGQRLSDNRFHKQL